MNARSVREASLGQGKLEHHDSRGPQHPNRAPGASRARRPVSHAVTIVVPAYNEEHGIRPVVEKLRDDDERLPVRVRDPGRRRRLEGRLAEEAARRRPGGPAPPEPHYGEALKTGIRHARFERIAIIDADGSYPPQEIPRLAALLDDAEMVVGARTSLNAAIPLIRRPAKKALTMLASYLTGRHDPGLNSGLRLFAERSRSSSSTCCRRSSRSRRRSRWRR